MREIEFRAWDKESKTMVYGPTPIQSWLGPQMTFDGRIYESVPTGIPGMGGYKYRDVILMQWTGLLDKDGEKIFDGDILGGIYGNGTVEYCDVCKSFQYHAMGTCFACEGEVHWGELVADDGKLEVVGNIYEHPDRMEENL